MCVIPSVFYTDHGSDFTSKHLKQVAVDMGIELIFSEKGVPRGRGKAVLFHHAEREVGCSRCLKRSYAFQMDRL